MTTPKKCTCQTVLVSLLALAICTFPALAYTPPIIVKGDDNLLPANNSTTVEMFVPMDSCGEFTQSSTPILYSSQFIDSNGNIYPVYESISNKACTHNFEPGEYNTHTKHSDGSCTVKNYSAQRCSKCGYVKRQNLLSTTKYPVCPHQLVQITPHIFVPHLSNLTEAGALFLDNKLVSHSSRIYIYSLMSLCNV